MIQKNNTLLTAVPLFSGLNEEEVRSLQALSKTRSYPKDNVLFLQGDPGDSFYLILSGEVKVAILGADGREYILSFLKSGDFFGEMSLFDSESRSASVVTTTAATFLIIQREAFLNYVTQTPSVLTKFLSTFSIRLRKTDAQLGDLALLNVHARIVKTLLMLAQTNVQEISAGQRIISKRLTHQDLASMVGTTRETVTRILNELKTQGHIANDGRKIIIHKSLHQYLDTLADSLL